MTMNLKHFLLAAVFGICLFGGGSLLYAASPKNEVHEKLLEYLKENKIRGIRDVVPIDLARLMVSEYRGSRVAIAGVYTGINTKLPQVVSAEYKETNFVFLSLAGKVPADKLLIVVPLKLNPKLPEILTSLQENQPILLIGKSRTVRPKTAKTKGKNKSSAAESRFFVFEVEQILPMPDDLPEPGPEAGKAVKEDQPEKADAAEETESESEENGEENEEAEETEEKEIKSEETKSEEKPATEQPKAQPTPAAENPPGSDEWE